MAERSLRYMSMVTASVAPFLLLALVASCDQPSGPDGAPQTPTVRTAKGGSGSIQVDDVEPSSVEQGVTFELDVFGAGFSLGSEVRFERNGKVAKGLTTNSTTVNSDTHIVANVTVALDAEPARYDVVVRKGPSKGVGTELLEVTQKFTPADDIPLTLTFRDEDTDGDGLCDDADGDGTTDAICGDGQGAIHDEINGSLRIREDGRMLFAIPMILEFRAPPARTGACASDGSCKKNFGVVQLSSNGTLVALEDDGSELSLLDMALNVQKRAQLFTGFHVPHPDLNPHNGSNPRYAVRYQFPLIDLTDPLNTTIASHSDFLWITRIVEDTWIVETDPGGLRAVLLNLFKDKGPTRTVDEGTYLIPTGFTIQCILAHQCQMGP